MKYLDKEMENKMDYDVEDNELLYLISEQNEDAKDIFYEKYKPTIEVMAKKYYPIIKNHGIELTDLIQEGMMGLTKAINTYSEQKDIKFKTFASKCIESEIVSFIRNCTRNKYKALNSSISIESTTNTNGVSIKDLIEDTKNLNPIDIISNDEDIKREKVLSSLTVKEKEAFLLRIEGFSYKEIASLQNTTVKSVERTLSRAKSKIENNNKTIDS